MKSRYSLLVVLVAVCVAGCERRPAERVEWTTMGTVAAVQVRGDVALSVLSQNEAIEI